MPTTEEHLEQARSNEQLAKTLRDGQSHFDWSITISFYSALHYLESYLISKSISVLDEAEQAKIGVQECRKQLAGEMLERRHAGIYTSLHQQSERARYFSSRNASPVQGIPAQYFTQVMARNWFGELEEFRNYILNLRS